MNNRKARVIAFYLPQFHPIPENDEWHGKGFTEWTKVKASKSLFKGHYQRHYPHPDIGHYIINGPEILKKQATMMRTAGLSGMVFYHYWFTGKLILEGPSQIVLQDKSIDMPFCFCWANENWSRRWDGNASEILLGQYYSREDAKNFIEYLIPFFKDERYITVDGRPVLIIYKPSFIEEVADYLNIWNRILSEHGLPSVYLVACISTKDEFDYDAYDCFLERPLYDFGGGNIKDIKNSLELLQSDKCWVLQYEDVVNYYINKVYKHNKKLWRSVVTSFDNTPRYGNRAYITHNSNPKLFEYWLTEMLKHSNGCQCEFVIVNAWNEWGESAHLEPDLKYGYAYLNAVGRSLSHFK